MLNTTFAALSDPTRRGIVELLAEEDRSVGDLVERFSLNQSTISRHLDVLENAGLISRERDGQRRICHLRGEALSEVELWVTQYRHFWTGALKRLDRALRKRKT